MAGHDNKCVCTRCRRRREISRQRMLLVGKISLLIVIVTTMAICFILAMLKAHRKAEKAEQWYAAHAVEAAYVVIPDDNVALAAAKPQEIPFWAEPGFNPERDYPRVIIAPEDK